MEAKTQPAKSDLAEQFARLYYAEVDPEDSPRAAPRDLAGAAAAHLAFGRRFSSGKPKSAPTTRRAAEHGWQSRHTVIEIVNDDMPFLVDSVTMEINRQGLTLHLIVHPICAVERDAERRAASASAAGEPPRPRASRSCTSRSTALIEPAKLAELAAGIARVLGDVRAAVEDWKPMRRAWLEAIAELEPRAAAAAARASSRKAAPSCNGSPTITSPSSATATTSSVGDDGEDVLRIVPGTGLGILRETAARRMSASFAALPPEARACARACRSCWCHQGEHALDRAPPGLPRLHRRQALRRATAR